MKQGIYPFTMIAGVDEAGRGPLAGPVCAAAVILHPDRQIEGLTDSKKLTEEAREKLFPQIQKESLAWSVAFAEVHEIDRINILQATMLAMQRAISGLSVEPHLIIIDGNQAPKIRYKVQTIIKGNFTKGRNSL